MAINELGNYLRARRQTVRPSDVGLPIETGRRVDGLRREEVARLAGISPEYYLRLEQGRDTHPSDQVLRSLARALNLDEVATAYLHRIADPPPLPSFAPLPGSLDDEVFVFLDGFEETAAYVISSCHDVLAVNDRASRIFAFGTVGWNLFDALFTDEARANLPRWEEHVALGISALRERCDPNDPRLHELVGRLLVREPDFARLWERHDVSMQSSGVNATYVPSLGRMLTLKWQSLAVPGNERLTLVAHYADPGTPEAEVLRSLGE
ncbi:helix-turn-helix transcriptional regulator [Homoserinibacter sp. GY 40078]|uniref:helix-turn-helix transcriptional regulator n=1 Tax=Homoserinibacter sp. GY 40078 TaxID=2603275 RepID=UPI0011C8C5CD|nr:helix-turn-helix transcriptional regulator [Homoserinibacter sp. GY 40078]TXK19320.1 helix-turn-helix domain-containing protein [Homoserinibacter sp. GY 40078]